MAASQQSSPVIPSQNNIGLGGIPGMSSVSGSSELMDGFKSEVAHEAAPLLTFILKHIKLIVGILLLVIAVIIGYGTWQWQTEKKLRAASMELGRILVMDNSQARVAALENFLVNAPESMRNGVHMEIAAAAVFAGDLQKAADAYGKVYSGDPHGAAGLLAAFNQADLLQRLNKPAEALRIFEILQGELPASLSVTIQERQAVAYEQTGQIGEALTRYEALLGASENSPAEAEYYRYKINMLKASDGK